MKVCPVCEAENSNSSQFCNSCGTWLPEDSYRPDPVPAFDPNNGAPQKKTSPTVIIVAIVAALIVIGGIIGTVLYVVNSKKPAEEAPATTVYSTTAATSAPTTTAPSTSAPSQGGIQGNTTTTTTMALSDAIDDPNAHLFPSDTQIITEAYLDTLTKEEIDLIRNELYARHGYHFQKPEYYNYFINKTWYNPTTDDMNVAESGFNDTERKNRDIIVKYQKDKGQL